MRLALKYLLAACAYVVLASGSVLLTRLDGGVAILWVANAIPVVQLCHLKRQDWPKPLLAALGAGILASTFFSPAPFAGTGFAIANVGEAALFGAVLARAKIGCAFFDTARAVRYFLLAAIVAPAASGLLGASMGAAAYGKPWLALWRDWVVGHTLGALIATPLLLLITSGDLIEWVRKLDKRCAAEALLLLSFVGAVSAAVFTQPYGHLLFLTVLPILIATFRLGTPGAALCLVIAAAIGGSLTALGYGPVALIPGSHAFQLQFFQAYLAAIFLMCIPVATTLRERDRLLTEIRFSESRYRLLADNVTDAILELSLDGLVLYASPAVKTLTGLDPGSIVGRNIADLVAPQDEERVRGAHNDALAEPGETITVDYRVAKADGTIGWFETRKKTIADYAGTPQAVVSVIRDITDRKLLESRLREAADTDPLTGLQNRRAFLRELDAAASAASAGKVATLALLDLDYFKRVNDEHGHAAGDTVLMVTADACRSQVRVEDRVARIGGEEFALLLQGASEAEAAIVCDRLRRAIAETQIPAAGGKLIAVTASIGLAEVTSSVQSEDALAMADAALYLAKEGGRNAVCRTSGRCA